MHSSDDEEVVKRRQEAKLVADLIEGKESRRHRHKRRRSKRKHKRYLIMTCWMADQLDSSTPFCNFFW